MPRACPVCGGAVEDDVARCPDDGAILLEERPRGILAGMVVGGRYALGPRIGGGALGDVYRAVDQTMGRSVAVKVLHPELSASEDAIERFFAQARLISRLKHPQTVTVHDFGKTPDGQGYLVMDLVEGEDLRRKLARDGRIPPQRALAIVRQIADSLAEAHAQGVVHACVKPEHVLLRDAFGRIDVVTVVDYGISAIARWDATAMGGGPTFGAAGYVSPEVLRGAEPTPRSDLYGLGVTLLETVTGSHPFAAVNTKGLVLRVLNEPPPPLHELAARLRLPPGVEPLIERLMALDPAERPADAAEVVAAIDEIQEASELDATTVFVMNPAAAPAPAVPVVRPTPRGEAEGARTAPAPRQGGARINSARSQADLPAAATAASEGSRPVAEPSIDEPRRKGRGLMVALLFLLLVMAGLAVAALIDPTLVDRFLPQPPQTTTTVRPKAPAATVAPVADEVPEAPLPEGGAVAEQAASDAAVPVAPAAEPDLREASTDLDRQDRWEPANEDEVRQAEKARKPTPRVLKPR